MDDVIAKIVEKLRSTPDQNLVVGISGIDGSGKSTLANLIAEELSRRSVPTAQVNLDDLLRPKSIRHKSEDQVKGYFEDNFDYNSLVTYVLEPARKMKCFKTQYPSLDLDTDQVTSRCLEFNGPGVLIVEGVFLFRKELRDKFHFKIWIEISFEAAMTRILNRSRDRRYGDVDAIRSRYEIRFFPTQRFHLERDHPSDAADHIFMSSDPKK